jgi:NADPH:quinone reductase-like Zn-dependent oxidoreductase
MATPARHSGKMTAIAISEPGGPRVLKPETRDVPEPGPARS